MESGFEYYAFISYKREDEKWAKWLQNKLLSYRLPSCILKENPHLPKRILHIFREKPNLEAWMLPEFTKYGLENSRYLIVICSPQSAKSNWVGMEIAEFVKMGRADHIIPFIVEGEPNSNNERECFHPVIKKEIPYILGININEIGKRNAFLKLVFKLLDIRVDSIWWNEKKNQRKQMIIAIVAGLLLAAGAYAIWNYFFRTTVEYYADYVDRWGIPEGVISLDKSKVKKRNSHYRFEIRGSKLRRVVFANSAGRPVNHNHMEHADRFAIQVLTYADMSNYKKNISHFELIRNDMGYITKKLFKKTNGENPASDASGIWGVEYELDDLGRPVELHYLGWANGKYFPSSDKTGIMGRRYEYDNYGNIIASSYLGIDGNLSLCKDGYAKVTYKYDEYGNRKEQAYFGSDGDPCFNNNHIARMTAEYDKQGNMTERSFFAINDSWEGAIEPGLYKITEEYNEHGNWTERAFFGIWGAPHSNLYGYAKVKAKYKGGNIIEETYFGEDGNPRPHRNGYVKWTAKYEHGNIIEESFIGYDGKLLLNNHDFAKVKWTYDKSGNRIQEAYWGINGAPCLHKNGFAKVAAKFDERGNRIETAYFGIDGNLRLNDDGYAKVKAEYDERGNRIETAFFGADDNPILLGVNDGKVIYNNDRRNTKVEPYFEIDSKLISDIKDYAKVTYSYDERGSIIETAYFGIDGNLRLNDDGYTKVKAEYDEHGNMIEEAYFDSDGNPCFNIFDVAKYMYKYDERRNRIEEAYFGTDGEPILVWEGYAKLTAKYDERGNRIEEAYFGTDGNPIFNEGYAKSTAEYNEYGDTIKMAFFDIDGKPIYSWTAEYDGNWFKKDYFRSDGNLFLTEDRNATTTYAYDERGNMIELVHYSNYPDLVDDWREVHKYDNSGNRTEITYFDIDGNPTSHVRDYAKVMYKYDNSGNIIEETYFGIDGKIIR